MEPIKLRGRSTVLILLALGMAWGALRPVETAAQAGPARQAYLRAVAEYFQLPEDEVSILADWDLVPDEIPVALFVATRAGISPEALVALRGSGRSWNELARRYQVGPAQLHVPLARSPSTGLLSSVYQQYQGRPVAEWGQITLEDEDIVTLINVRVLSSTLGMRPDEVLARRVQASSFVDVYARIIG